MRQCELGYLTVYYNEAIILQLWTILFFLIMLLGKGKLTFEALLRKLGVGGWVSAFLEKSVTPYGGVRFNVISVTRGWMGSNCKEKSVT